MRTQSLGTLPYNKEVQCCTSVIQKVYECWVQERLSALSALLHHAQLASTWEAAEERRPGRARCVPQEALAHHQASLAGPSLLADWSE